MPDAPANRSAHPHGALPIGTRLGEFEIKRVLGVGGFGIVYLAFDHLLEREVALKEYMPASLVERNETLHVTLLSQDNADTFALGLRSFVNEARLLARFDHPSLVKVHRFWEANSTAYMAMALYKGRTVRDVRMDMQQRPDEAWVRRLLDPLLGAIERLHSEDVFHRDIAPDNILLEADGRPVLLDFGAARRVITDRSQALTAILKPSYAPIEQYADVSGMKQGAWTDIYALGATVHFLLLGKPPPPAPGRSIQDSLTPLAAQTLPGCSREFLEVIDWMLAPLPTDRPQSVAQVRDALAGQLKRPGRDAERPFERTTPFTGNDDATVVIPRGGATAWSPDAATQVVPRSALAQPPVAAGAPADDDATVVRPVPTAYVPSRHAAPATAATPTSRPPVAPPPQTAWQPPSAPEPTQHVPRPPHAQTVQLPPHAPAQGGRGWLVPVLSGAVVALGVGAGLWWFLTRPVAPELRVDGVQTLPSKPAAVASSVVAPTPAPAAPVASAAAQLPVAEASAPVAPAPTPAPAPVTTQPPAATAPAPVAESPKPAAVKPGAVAATKPQAAPAVKQGRPGDAVAPAPVAPRPVEVAPAPAPAPATAPPVVAEPPRPAHTETRPQSPSERCANEAAALRELCIDRACYRSEFNKHPECVKLRAEQAQKRYLEGR